MSQRNVTKKFLIQSAYGFQGFVGNTPVNLNYGGCNIWCLTYDGTLKELHEVFANAQQSSDHVKEFNAAARTHGLDPGLGRWTLFSVIDSEVA